MEGLNVETPNPDVAVIRRGNAGINLRVLPVALEIADRLRNQGVHVLSMDDSNHFGHRWWGDDFMPAPGWRIYDHKDSLAPSRYERGFYVYVDPMPGIIEGERMALAVATHWNEDFDSSRVRDLVLAGGDFVERVGKQEELVQRSVQRRKDRFDIVLTGAKKRITDSYNPDDWYDFRFRHGFDRLIPQHAHVNEDILSKDRGKHYLVRRLDVELGTGLFGQPTYIETPGGHQVFYDWGARDMQVWSRNAPDGFLHSMKYFALVALTWDLAERYATRDLTQFKSVRGVLGPLTTNRVMEEALKPDAIWTGLRGFFE